MTILSISPGAFWLFGTLAILVIGSINATVRYYRDLARFRENLKPGLYVRLKTATGEHHAKLIFELSPGYFQAEVTNDRSIIYTPVKNIFKP